MEEGLDAQGNIYGKINHQELEMENQEAAGPSKNNAIQLDWSICTGRREN